MQITKIASDYRRGFTLIEALMASVVLAFCVIGICGLFITSIQQRSYVESSEQGTEASRATIENLLSYGLDELSPAVGTASVETLSPSQLRASDSTQVQGTIHYIVRNVSQAPRDLGVVEVVTTSPDGKQTKTHRLLSRAKMP
ncbi:MAG: hypothetical protein KatS3mg104_1288 [Phycisphaerae bacterium]|jgi:prepilin-type N-terminal cleavage/methylation domain-containing protein|nr:MAG: hypothetical protein KatS3mg104_1288 [Phycisphaerae bacterium]